MLMKHVLLIEDELIVAMDIKMSLEKKNGFVVSTARNYTEALKIYNNKLIDVVVCDVNLNTDKDGIEVIEAFSLIKPVPVVYLTAYDNPEILERAKKTLPYAYLLKPFNESQLVLTLDLAHLNFKRQEKKLVVKAENQNKLKDLTLREKEVLIVLATGKTSKEIADTLNISQHTVDKHKKNIKKKLGLNTIGELVKFAYSTNLKTLN